MTCHRPDLCVVMCGFSIMRYDIYIKRNVTYSVDLSQAKLQVNCFKKERKRGREGGQTCGGFGTQSEENHVLFCGESPWRSWSWLPGEVELNLGFVVLKLHGCKGGQSRAWMWGKIGAGSSRAAGQGIRSTRGNLRAGLLGRGWAGGGRYQQKEAGSHVAGDTEGKRKTLKKLCKGK